MVKAGERGGKQGWSWGTRELTRRNIRESLGDKVGAGVGASQGTSDFCVEGGPAFLLLIVPGARIPTYSPLQAPLSSRGLPLAAPVYF